MNPVYRRAKYLVGAHQLRQAPPDRGAEIAFAGRSNAGKSSVINTITGISGLARTSKTPGRTQLLNFFTLDDAERRLVDLPGYGYAKVPESARRHWRHTLEEYLRTRRSLRGLILVMDIRHPLTDFDQQLLAWCSEAGMAVHVLLTKADKLKRGPALAALDKVRRALAARFGDQVSVQLFSAKAKTGVDEAHAVLDHWLQ